MGRVRYLADEDFRHAIVAAAKRLDPTIEITTVFDAGCAGLEDPQILDYAAVHGLIVVSHDVNTMTHFALLRVEKGLPMPGIFLAAQSQSTRKIAEDLVLVATASELEEWAHRIVFLPI